MNLDIEDPFLKKFEGRVEKIGEGGIFNCRLRSYVVADNKQYFKDNLINSNKQQKSIISKMRNRYNSLTLDEYNKIPMINIKANKYENEKNINENLKNDNISEENKITIDNINDKNSYSKNNISNYENMKEKINFRNMKSNNNSFPKIFQRNSIINDSAADTGFTGYKLINNIYSSRGMTNRAKTDITINNININGPGTGFVQASNSKLTINNSTIDSTTQGYASFTTERTDAESEMVLNNINANNRIVNDNYSYRKLIIKNSILETDDTSVQSEVFNFTGKLETDNVTFKGCPSIYIENYSNAVIKDSKFEISEDCHEMPRVFSGGAAANMLIKDTKFIKHSQDNVTNNDYFNNKWHFIENSTHSNLVVDSSDFDVDYLLNAAIRNNGGYVTIKGETTIDSNFTVGVINRDGWDYNRYNGSLTIGEDDTNVSTEYPKIKGNTYAIWTIQKDSSNTMDENLYYYDGLLDGELGKTLYSSVSDKPDDYDLNSNINESRILEYPKKDFAHCDIKVSRLLAKYGDLSDICEYFKEGDLNSILASFTMMHENYGNISFKDWMQKKGFKINTYYKNSGATTNISTVINNYAHSRFLLKDYYEQVMRYDFSGLYELCTRIDNLSIIDSLLEEYELTAGQMGK